MYLLLYKLDGYVDMTDAMDKEKQFSVGNGKPGT